MNTNIKLSAALIGDKDSNINRVSDKQGNLIADKITERVYNSSIKDPKIRV